MEHWLDLSLVMLDNDSLTVLVLLLQGDLISCVIA